MPRQARIIIANMPHHIVQRGHNKQAVFFETADYKNYLENLQELKQMLDLRVYGYCLMTNHIHLIVNPGETPPNISELMKRLAGRHTRYINKTRQRTGSSWESRFKISPIQSDEYPLQCCRYVDLNPVKARMCQPAEMYRWSRYRAKIGQTKQNWLDEDPTYLALGDSPDERRVAYKTFVADRLGTNKAADQLINTAVGRNQLTGDSKFIDGIETCIGIRIEFRGRGKPGKVKK
jgi:putative transposase